MFTGLVEDLGTITALTSLQGSGLLRLRRHRAVPDLAAAPRWPSMASAGDGGERASRGRGRRSVPSRFEPLRWAGGDLGSRAPRAPLRLGDRLGGHLGSGHVDGVGEESKRSGRGGDGWDVGSARPRSSPHHRKRRHRRRWRADGQHRRARTTQFSVSLGAAYARHVTLFTNRSAGE